MNRPKYVVIPSSKFGQMLQTASHFPSLNRVLLETSPRRVIPGPITDFPPLKKQYHSLVLQQSFCFIAVAYAHILLVECVNDRGTE